MTVELKHWFNAALHLHSVMVEIGAEEVPIVLLADRDFRILHDMCLEYSRIHVVEFKLDHNEVKIHGVIFRMKEASA